MENNLVIVGGKLASGETLIVSSNAKDGETILKTYKSRWSIKSMFHNMKEHGFCFEKTHMKNLERLKKLMLVVAVAVLLACLMGHKLKSPYKKKFQHHCFPVLP
jgi:transposase